jgi:hypothetical protein
MAKPAPELQVIQGIVSQLHVGEATVNLLRSQQGAVNTVAGVGSVLAEQYGNAANAAMVANYGGEDVDMFACYVGDQLVQGCFSRVMFANGDHVKVVTDKLADAEQLHAYAVLRPSDGLLSMPYNTGRGIWAEFWKNMRWGAWLYSGSMLFIGLCIWYASTPNDRSIELFALSILIGFAIMLSMSLWAFFSESEGQTSTAIFKALKFPRSEHLNLKPSSICPYEGYANEHSIFRYRRIVKAADDVHGAPEPEPLKPFHVALAERQKEQKSNGS